MLQMKATGTKVVAEEVAVWADGPVEDILKISSKASCSSAGLIKTLLKKSCQITRVAGESIA